MHDQANRLRDLAAARHAPAPVSVPSRVAAAEAARPRIIVVTSGKGGVGKTNIASNLAILCAGMRRRVLLLDADANLGNAELVLGLSPTFRLSHVVRGEVPLSRALVGSYNGLKVLAGDSGKVDFPALTPSVQQALIAAAGELEAPPELVLIDTSAGLTDEILSFAARADEAIIVTTPEPTAVMDAYAMAKLIRHEALGVGCDGGGNRMPVLRLIVNMARSGREAEATFQNLESVVQHFLDGKLELLGWLPHDEAVGASVCAQTPVVVHAPHSPAAVSLRAIAHKLLVNGR